MPDFERPLRSLELKTATTPEEKSYVAGMHAGMDKARWQIAKLCMGVTVCVLIYKLVQFSS